MTIPNVNVDDAIAASLMNQIIDRLNTIDSGSSRFIVFGPASGVYTVPNGVTKLHVILCGGGGGNTPGDFETPSTNGGDSPLGDKLIAGLEPGASIAYNVGARGVIGGGASYYGTTGGSSNFGSHMGSSGGAGGSGNPFAPASNGTLSSADVQLGNATYIDPTNGRSIGRGGGVVEPGGDGTASASSGILIVEY